jgi:hypothetical protein
MGTCLLAFQYSADAKPPFTVDSESALSPSSNLSCWYQANALIDVPPGCGSRFVLVNALFGSTADLKGPIVTEHLQTL